MTENHFITVNGITFKYDPNEIDIDAPEIQQAIKNASTKNEKIIRDGAVSIYYKQGILIIDTDENRSK